MGQNKSVTGSVEVQGVGMEELWDYGFMFG